MVNILCGYLRTDRKDINDQAVESTIFDVIVEHLEHRNAKASAKGKFQKSSWSNLRFNFRNADIQEVTTLDNTIFHKFISFRNTAFRSMAFINMSFEGKVTNLLDEQDTACADFSGVKFEWIAQFNGTRFGWGVVFNNAEFGRVTQFDETKYYGNVTFSNSKFNGNARFDGAEFHGDVMFSDAKFNRAVSFDGAKFNSELREDYNDHYDFGMIPLNEDGLPIGAK